LDRAARVIDPVRANIVVPSVYGPIIVNRHAGEADTLMKFGTSHSHKDIELVCVLARCGGPDALVIDVGACFGAFTLALARVLAETNSRVLSFEPQRWLYHCMCGTLALNDITNV
jgi:predicted O-methyltransferase YrrM